MSTIQGLDCPGGAGVYLTLAAAPLIGQMPAKSVLSPLKWDCVYRPGSGSGEAANSPLFSGTWPARPQTRLSSYANGGSVLESFVRI